MLPALMRRPLAIVLCLLVAPAALAVAACGEEEEIEVVEGEPLHLGELSYNVQLTRFLNPDDAEDAEYLLGQDPPPPGQAYLGVFMVVENESEESLSSSSDYTVVDTTEQSFSPLDSESPYALNVGEQVPGEGELPLADTTAATGPNQGAMLIFLVPDEVSENRPLELQIAGEDATGTVELDI
jgi:hypothetical protein